MSSQGPRIIFMGTPEFAVPSLEILIENGFNVVAVITAPDKPKGRGQKMSSSPVKECALSHQVPVLQPTNLKAPEFLETLRTFQADLQVVVAFRMLPESVWSMPRLGTFNLHASLLPDYRGAAPINWAIMNGEKITGVTTFFLQHEIDTGDILFQEQETILDTDDAGTLYERLMRKGAKLVLKTVTAIQAGTYQQVPQRQTVSPKLAPKLFKENCQIDWSWPAVRIGNFVRGLSPYPAAWTILHGKNFKIFNVHSLRFDEATSVLAGQTRTDNKNYLYVKSGDDWISIDSFQPEGKKRMTAAEYFRGNQLI